MKWTVLPGKGVSSKKLEEFFNFQFFVLLAFERLVWRTCRILPEQLGKFRPVTLSHNHFIFQKQVKMLDGSFLADWWVLFSNLLLRCTSHTNPEKLVTFYNWMFRSFFFRISPSQSGAVRRKFVLGKWWSGKCQSNFGKRH